MKKVFLIIFLLFGVFQISSSVQSISCPLEIQKAYKVAGAKSIYYITEYCTKRPFTKAHIYFTYFRSWNDVKVTSNELLSSISNDVLGFMPFGPLYDPQYGALVKTTSDPKVYLLLGNEKYWISSENIFSQLRYSWNWIEDIDIRLLNKYQVGSEINYTDHHPNYTLIKYLNDPKVYRLEPKFDDSMQQVKRYITSEKEFNELKFRWDRIVVIPDSEQYQDKNASVVYIPVLEGCQYANPSCSEGFECIQNQCIPKKVEVKKTPVFSDFSWKGRSDSCGNNICELNEENNCSIDCAHEDFFVLEEKQLSVLVPKGYEALAEPYMTDLKYCFPLIKEFLGGITPYHDHVFLQTRIAEKNLGYSNGIGLFYNRTQSNMDFDLDMVVQNNPEGFLYKSSPTFCADTHEFVHVFTYHYLSYFPSWTFEGIAEYTQKNIQKGSKDHLECKSNGIYVTDYWGDGKKKVFPYIAMGSDFDNDTPSFGPMWYATGMCFWEDIDQVYGREKFLEIFKRMQDFGEVNIPYTGEVASQNLFFDDILVPVLGDQVKDHIKEKFGLK
jgi:hypothetical protein